LVRSTRRPSGSKMSCETRIVAVRLKGEQMGPKQLQLDIQKK
jgi:hypothetical protein